MRMRAGAVNILGFLFVFMAFVASGMGILGFWLLSKTSTLSEIQKQYQTFLEREIDHLHWVLKARQEAWEIKPLSVQKDYTKCQLGKWIYEGGRSTLETMHPELRPLLDQLEKHHQQLHAVAEPLEKALEEGDVKKAQHLAFVALSAPLSLVREDLKAIRQKLMGEVKALGDDFVTVSQKFRFWFGVYLVIYWILAAVLGWWQRRFMGQVFSKVLEQSQSLISKILSGVETLSQTHQGLQQVVVEQAASSQSTAASVTEIEMLSNRNAQASDQMRQSSERMANSLEEGYQNVAELKNISQNLIDIGQNLWQQTELNVQELQSIVDIFKTIEQKISSIHEIVFQTRLLSFNASIEAARAGSHGAGFSVVAQEVRKLADMSGQVAAEISSLLTQSQSQVIEIINQISERSQQLIHSSQKEIQVSFEKVENIVAIFNQFKSDVGQLVEMINQINLSLKDQKLGLTEISQAIHKMDKSIQMTRQNMGNLQSAVQDLSHEIQDSEKLISEIKLIAFGQKADHQDLRAKQNGDVPGVAGFSSELQMDSQESEPPQLAA